MHRPEAGGRGQNDDVGKIDDALVRIEAVESALGRHVDLRALPLGALFGQDVLEAALHPILEGISHRDELRVRVGPEGLDGRSGAPAAAADETDPDRIGARPPVERIEVDLREGDAAEDGCRRLHEVPAPEHGTADVIVVA